MFAGMRPFLEEEVFQFFFQVGRDPIQVVAATTNDESLAIGNEKRVCVQQPSRPRLSFIPVARNRKRFGPLEPKRSPLQDKLTCRNHYFTSFFDLIQGTKNGTSAQYRRYSSPRMLSRYRDSHTAITQLNDTA